MSDTEKYAGRRERLRAKIRETGLAGLIVAHAANRYYLSGFELSDPQCNETAGWLLITAGGDDRLLTDPRYKEAAERVWDPERMFIYSRDKYENIRKYISEAAHGEIGFEADALSVKTMREISAGLSLEEVTGFVESLRVVKDEEEIRTMRKSCALNHKVFRQLEELIMPGASESELAWEAEKLFRTQGASEMAFDPIVAVGPNAALPHAVPGEDTVEQDGLVLVDLGGRFGGYCSDQSRTFWTGSEPSEEFKRTLAQVREAQAAAIDTLRPGLAASEAYAVARRSFEKYGVAEHFTHGLGHGVGLETHERPSLSPSSEAELRSGMVVTVEPGLYYSGWGGVRWEFMVLITEDGCEIL